MNFSGEDERNVPSGHHSAKQGLNLSPVGSNVQFDVNDRTSINNCQTDELDKALSKQKLQQSNRTTSDRLQPVRRRTTFMKIERIAYELAVDF